MAAGRFDEREADGAHSPCILGFVCSDYRQQVIVHQEITHSRITEERRSQLPILNIRRSDVQKGIKAWNDNMLLQRKSCDCRENHATAEKIPLDGQYKATRIAPTKKKKIIKYILRKQNNTM